MFEHLDDPHQRAVPADALSAAVRRGTALRQKRRLAVAGGVALGFATAIGSVVLATVPRAADLSTAGGHVPEWVTASPHPSSRLPSPAASSSSTRTGMSPGATQLTAACDDVVTRAASVRSPADWQTGEPHLAGVSPAATYTRTFTASADSKATIRVDVVCGRVAGQVGPLSPSQLAALRPDADASVSVQLGSRRGLPTRVVTSRRGDEVSLLLRPSAFIEVKLAYHQPAGEPWLSVDQLWALIDDMSLPPA